MHISAGVKRCFGLMMCDALNVVEKLNKSYL